MIKNTIDSPIQHSLPEALCEWDKKPCLAYFVCAIWYFPKQIIKSCETKNDVFLLKDRVVASVQDFSTIDHYDYLDLPFCSLSCVKQHIQSHAGDILYEHALYLTMQMYNAEKIEIDKK